MIPYLVSTTPTQTQTHRSRNKLGKELIGDQGIRERKES